MITFRPDITVAQMRAALVESTCSKYGYTRLLLLVSWSGGSCLYEPCRRQVHTPPLYTISSTTRDTAAAPITGAQEVNRQEQPCRWLPAAFLREHLSCYRSLII